MVGEGVEYKFENILNARTTQRCGKSYSVRATSRKIPANTSTGAPLQPFMLQTPCQMALYTILGCYFTNWFNSNIGNSTASTIASTTTPMNNIIAGSIIAASAAMRVSISRCC